ncbi:cysteine proteinase [Plenodomus tracheiphilus IPT5]|uniref:Cysteine proteinase n=1 Tax=Plenodomus tracheiphilus IPT5 TaxID=1408161 RepID=A0A6A7AVQ8_9PLEO|nr:cysteine proteinase [Plenodomus tracheiphilus IPT5]
MANELAIPELAPETLETLQTRHRKEQRDLVSRITQKKKQATKKTRKGVNDECERLERELKERQDAEVAELKGERPDEAAEDDDASDSSTQDAQDALADLNISPPHSSTQTPSTNGDTAEGKKKKPNRAKARLARRAADTAAMIASAEAEAANAPNPREIERERMAQQLKKRGLALHEIRADGHCLYAAVADQLTTRELGLTPRISVTIAAGSPEANGNTQSYKKVRHAAADFIQEHPESFDGFTEDPLPEHVRKIRETGEWGGHLELLALARSYGVRICVLHSDGSVNSIPPEEDERNNKAEKEVAEIWLGYYKHSHGLGEHYNSLRKVN